MISREAKGFFIAVVLITWLGSIPAVGQIIVVPKEEQKEPAPEEPPPREPPSPPSRPRAEDPGPPKGPEFERLKRCAEQQPKLLEECT